MTLAQVLSQIEAEIVASKNARQHGCTMMDDLKAQALARIADTEQAVKDHLDAMRQELEAYCTQGAADIAQHHDAQAEGLRAAARALTDAIGPVPRPAVTIVAATEASAADSGATPALEAAE